MFAQDGRSQLDACAKNDLTDNKVGICSQTGDSSRVVRRRTGAAVGKGRGETEVGIRRHTNHACVNEEGGTVVRIVRRAVDHRVAAIERQNAATILDQIDPSSAAGGEVRIKLHHTLGSVDGKGALAQRRIRLNVPVGGGVDEIEVAASFEGEDLGRGCSKSAQNVGDVTICTIRSHEAASVVRTRTKSHRASAKRPAENGEGIGRTTVERIRADHRARILKGCATRVSVLRVAIGVATKEHHARARGRVGGVTDGQRTCAGDRAIQFQASRVDRIHRETCDVGNATAYPRGVKRIAEEGGGG